MFQEFAGPNCKPQLVYTDNPKELDKSLHDLGWPHDTAIEHRPQTNGVAERAVQRVKQGTSVAIVQNGLLGHLWGLAMRCATFLKHVVDLLQNRKTSYEMRFGEPFRGPIFPFGCEIYYEPITDDDKSKCHSLGAKVLSGIFVGYKPHHGGGWTGDLRIIDWIQMENAEGPSDVYIKTFKSSLSPY